MNDKEQLIAQLRDVLNRWEEVLEGMSEEQITVPQPSSGWSIKDDLIHLWGWQQVSVARMEAALHGKEPEYPNLAEMAGPDPEGGNVDRANAWLHETNRGKPWSSVYGDWKAQFLRFLDLSEQVPESDLLPIGKYTWLEHYPLSAVLIGSYEHHVEHLEELLAQLGQVA
ncbi:MAG: ClbS/DfsB family four-helix bundle protein [Chloroflexia bacterium]